MDLNPDNTFRRLVNDGPRRCNCGAMAMIFVQTMGVVGDCMACGIAAGIVGHKSVDIQRKNYPKPDQIRTPRQDGKEKRERERLGL